MTYSKYFSSQEVKIPVPITIGVIILVIVVLGKVFSITPPVPSKASQENIKMLSVVNLSPNHAGLYWQTDKKEKGWIIYGENQTNLQLIALDDRDLQNNRMPYINHYVILDSLKPGSLYYYKIVSNDQLITDQGGKPFSFSTPTSLELSTDVNPAYGKVIKANGDGLENAVALLSFTGAYPLLAITKSTGEWLIPLHSLLDKNTLKIRTPRSTDEAKLAIYSEDQSNSQIKAVVSHLSPLPQTVIIGQNYDFTGSENVLSATSVKTSVPSGIIDILFPKENSSIPGGEPLIKGTGVKGKIVMVFLDPPRNTVLQTTVDEQGIWKVNLHESLSAGQHKLTLQTQDTQGKNVQVIRNFTIIKSGEQVLGQATAEATPTLPISTATPNPAATIYPTLSPSQPIVSLTPTAPTSGSDIVPMAIGSASLILVGIGILLAF